MSGGTWELVQKIFMVAGGLGLFLYGMKMMSDGLENMAGDRMRGILERATSNRFLGIGLGTAVTMVIQSSSATTVMMVGFVNASLMTLAQAIGVIMGANIGTTITAQIISFKIDPIAPLIIFVGVIVHLFFKKRGAKNLGYILMGFGILFFGITVMGDPLEAFGKDPGFANVLTTFQDPILALLAGMIFTAIIQSSSATTGIIVALYASGVALPFTTAAFIVLGSNIGTCITAMLASLAASREAKRAALAHVLFNVIGCVIFGTLISVFPGILTWIQATFDAPERQVAMFHTFFNCLTVLVLVGFVNQLARVVQKIIPERAGEKTNEKRLVYLDQSIIQTPAIAVTQAQRELCRMGGIVWDNMQLSLEAFFTQDAEKAAQVLETESTIDYLNHQITAWLVRMRGLELSAHDSEKLGMMLRTVSDIERVGDHAENIAEYAMMEGQNLVKISPDALEELRILSTAAMKVLALALDIFENRDEARLPQVNPLELEVDTLSDECIAKHIQRLKDRQCDPGGGVVYTDMVTDLERSADHATNIAYSILGETVWDARRHELRRV